MSMNIPTPTPFSPMVIQHQFAMRRIVTVLGAMILFFIVAGGGAVFAWHRFGLEWLHEHHLQQLTTLLLLDAESNLPSYFQTFNLLFCSVLLLIISWLKKETQDRFLWHWRLLAAIFLLLSIDEAASVHEATVRPLREALHTSGALYFAWVVPAIFLVLVLGLAYLRFIWALPAVTRWLVILGGAFYVGGTVGMEMVGGKIVENFGEGSMVYALGTVAEESLEMIGLFLFTWALLAYLNRHLRELRVTLTTSG